MGKSSKYPAYAGGVVSVNGQQKASTYRNGNDIVTNYNMSDAEKRAYNYAQNSFADSLSRVNVFDADTQKNLQKQLDAYTANGQKLINNTYTPMLNNLKSDIAARFGNFDNSVFMDNLNNIESKRAESMSDLAQDVMAKRSDLINNELSQRYSYLSFLQDIQNQANSNMFNFINSSQQNSTSGNNYNAQAYAANQAAKNKWLDYAKLASGVLEKAGPYGYTSTLLTNYAKQSSQAK